MIDPEEYHGDEDQFALDILKAIADGHAKPAELAAVAVDVLEMERARWYA